MTQAPCAGVLEVRAGFGGQTPDLGLKDQRSLQGVEAGGQSLSSPPSST